MASLPERVDGRTTFGTTNQAQCGVAVNTALGSVSYFALVDKIGNAWYLWMNSAGLLMIGSSIPTDPDVGGTIVGTQP